MATRTHLGVILAAGVWTVWGVALCRAQTTPANKQDNPAPCSVTPQPDPCGAKPAAGSKPSTAEKFPFPGEPTEPATTPSLSGVPDAPEKKGAAKEFPFPGEPSPADSGKPDLTPGAGSSSSSSSSDGNAGDPTGSGDTPELKDKGSEGSNATPGRHILHRVNPVATKLQTTADREAEDLSIAQFYTQTGNYAGAYLRTKDAVTLAPDDADAHFALAEIAAKLGKRDEAIAEYNACLKLDASDKEIKESRKALARLKSQ